MFRPEFQPRIVVKRDHPLLRRLMGASSRFAYTFLISIFFCKNSVRVKIQKIVESFPVINHPPFFGVIVGTKICGPAQLD